MTFASGGMSYQTLEVVFITLATPFDSFGPNGATLKLDGLTVYQCGIQNNENTLKDDPSYPNGYLREKFTTTTPGSFNTLEIVLGDGQHENELVEIYLNGSLLIDSANDSQMWSNNADPNMYNPTKIFDGDLSSSSYTQLLMEQQEQLLLRDLQIDKSPSVWKSRPKIY